jgi:hypothetical protein
VALTGMPWIGSVRLWTYAAPASRARSTWWRSAVSSWIRTWTSSSRGFPSKNRSMSRLMAARAASGSVGSVVQPGGSRTLQP